MNRVTVRRIDVVRAANIVAALYAVAVVIFGLVVFVPLALIGGLAGARGGDASATTALGAGIAGGIVFFLIAVVFYGVIGWITTAIACALYNVVAGRIGGFQVLVDMDAPYQGGYPAPYPGAYPGGPQAAASAAPMTWPAPAPAPGPGPTTPGGPPPAPGR